MKTRVVHLINGLGKGGAETMLYQIIKYRTENAPDYMVISLGLSHYYEEMIKALKVDVVEFDFKKHPVKAILGIRRILRRDDILCCWMYIANLIGYVAGRKKVSKLIWCIRHSDLSRRNNSRKTLIINKICAKLSTNVDAIAYNGNLARKVHSEAGYVPIKDCVLNNGLDLSEYHKDDVIKAQLRKEFGIAPEKKVILSVARNHPIKDIPTFIKAFSDLKMSRNDVIAVMCGQDITGDNDYLIELCRKNGLIPGNDVIFLGFRENVNEILNIADVYVLHSAGEAFPNTLIQAMACGIPVVSTDVGDVAGILESNEFVVKVGDHALMAEKTSFILDMKDEDRQRLMRTNRIIVEERYDIHAVVKSYENLFSW